MTRLVGISRKFVEILFAKESSSPAVNHRWPCALPFSMMLHFGTVSEMSFRMESSQINLGLHHLNQGRVINPVYPAQSCPGVPSVDIQRSYNRIDAFQGHTFNYAGGAIESLRGDSGPPKPSAAGREYFLPPGSEGLQVWSVQ
jgi:hypothetical protein